MKGPTDPGAMPAKVFEHIRARATAGLAKLVEDVNQYAAAMYAPTANSARSATGSREAEHDEDEAEGGDGLSEEVRPARAMMGGERDRGIAEHRVRCDRPGDATGELRSDVDARDLRRHAAEEAIDERDDGVEMGARHRSERKDHGREHGRSGKGVLEQFDPDGTW